ncbi:hypothetical protein [Arthrobacter psychrolactophilus]
MTDAAEGAVGVSDRLHTEDVRARAAFSRLTGFEQENITLIPATSYGLFQLAFGVRGKLSWSARENSPPTPIPGCERSRPA